MSKKAGGLGEQKPSAELEESHKDIRRTEGKSRMSEVSHDVRPPAVEFASKFDFSYLRGVCS